MTHKFILTSSKEEFADSGRNEIISLLEKSPDSLHLISLSGGNTPYPVYANLPIALKERELQNKVFFIQTDERNVPPSSPRSNQNAIIKSLFHQEGLPIQQFIPLKTGDHDFSNSLEICFSGLPKVLAPPKPIEILILGMGSDGHTASLFPKTDWRSGNTQTGYKLFSTDDQPEQRISLTIDRILAAKEIIFLISGEDKAEALNEVFLNKNLNLPAAYIAKQRPTTWVLSPETVSSFPKSRTLAER